MSVNVLVAFMKFQGDIFGAGDCVFNLRYFPRTEKDVHEIRGLIAKDMPVNTTVVIMGLTRLEGEPDENNASV